MTKYDSVKMINITTFSAIFESKKRTKKGPLFNQSIVHYSKERVAKAFKSDPARFPAKYS